VIPQCSHFFFLNCFILMLLKLALSLQLLRTSPVPRTALQHSVNSSRTRAKFTCMPLQIFQSLARLLWPACWSIAKPVSIHHHLPCICRLSSETPKTECVSPQSPHAILQYKAISESEPKKPFHSTIFLEFSCSQHVRFVPESECLFGIVSDELSSTLIFLQAGPQR
jgi:hypothetical protein